MRLVICQGKISLPVFLLQIDIFRDIEWMRGQLIQLGFDVPHRKYLPEKSDDPKSGRTYSELGKDRLATGLPSSLSATRTYKTNACPTCSC